MKNSTIPLLLLIIPLALTANILWLYEIVRMIGWDGTQWVRQEHFSIFIINGLAIFAYFFPIWQNPEVRDRFKNKTNILIVALILLYSCTMTSYYIAKWFLLASRWYFAMNPHFGVLLALILLVGTPMLFHWISHKFFFPIVKKQIIALILGIMLTFYLSCLSIDYYSGYGSGKNLVDAIKMGYPFFWIVLMMGGIGIATNRWWLLTEERRKLLLEHEDVLDV